MQTQVPLLLLTADRPAELIGCGANQAINQQGLFSHFVAQSLYLPAADQLIERQEEIDNRNPESDQKTISDALQQVRQIIAVARNKGPVQINCPFREPLYLQPSQPPYQMADDPEREDFFATSMQPGSDVEEAAEIRQEPLWSNLSQQDGIIIAGAMSNRDAKAVVALAKQLGWPLLADLQSQCRADDNALGHYDLWLTLSEAQQQFAKAQLVLQFGGRLISKRLQQTLAQQTLQNYWLIAASEESLDPLAKCTRQINAPISDWIEQQRQLLGHQQATTSNPLTPCYQLFQQLENASRQHIERHFKQPPSAAISELAAVYQLGQLLDENCLLMAGNSLPVRLLELLASKLQTPLFANRGASGIDGLLATACGIAAADPARPCVLLIGDMSLLYDLNSLALLARHSGALVVVVLNNGGGNIFHTLPVPRSELERLFQQPTAWQLANVCEGFKVNYAAPATLAAFQQQLTYALSAATATVIELQLPAGEGVSQLQRVLATFATRADHDK
jgi:2-succinyl-5-enolpyruvyl-6-hydroxy-3-cyclohexene-1-carboxylate synthase